jgi:hypothetical protein
VQRWSRNVSSLSIAPATVGKKRLRATQPQALPHDRGVVAHRSGGVLGGPVVGRQPGIGELSVGPYAPLFESREQPPNGARFTFLDPAAQEFFVDWEKAAKDLVAALRSIAGRNPYDRALSDLVGELSTRSEAFRTWWAAHNVRYHQTGTKRLHHPVVGELELSYEVMELAADAGLRLAIFTAEPGTRSEEALNLLASWAATPDQLPGEGAAADDARRP